MAWGIAGRRSATPALYPTRKPLPDRHNNGRKQHVLELSTTFGTTEVWYFDSASGLLTRTEMVEDRDKKGPVQVTHTLEDYREVDGVRLPFRTVVQEGKDKYTIKVKSVKHNAAIEPENFAPPM